MTDQESGDARPPLSFQVEDTQEEVVWDILGELVGPEAADRMIKVADDFVGWSYRPWKSEISSNPPPETPTLSIHHIVLKTVSCSSWYFAKDQMLE
jgi:hypothetical protein